MNEENSIDDSSNFTSSNATKYIENSKLRYIQNTNSSNLLLKRIKLSHTMLNTVGNFTDGFGISQKGSFISHVFIINIFITLILFFN